MQQFSLKNIDVDNTFGCGVLLIILFFILLYVDRGSMSEGSKRLFTPPAFVMNSKGSQKGLQMMRLVRWESRDHHPESLLGDVLHWRVTKIGRLIDQ